MKHGWILAGLALMLGNPCGASAATDTWDGGSVIDNNLSSGQNWADNTAPVSDLVNTDLIFSGGLRRTPNVSAALSANSITFDNTVGSFVFGGQTLNIGAGGILNTDLSTMTFNNPVSFSGVPASTINALSGALVFSSVTLPSGTLTVTGANPTTFTNIAGNGALNKLGAGTMTWTPATATAFDVTIEAGRLTIGADGVSDVFTNSSTIAVNGASRLDLNETVTLDGAQLTVATDADLNIATGKTLRVQNGGDVMIAGAYANSTASMIAISGTGSTFATNNALDVRGGSTLSIAGGGALLTGLGSLNIGLLGGDGTVTVDGFGSSLSSNGLRLAQGGFDGSLSFTNGGAGTFLADLFVAGGSGGNGSLQIESGSTVTGTRLAIAASPTAESGTVTITGTGSALTLANEAFIGSAGSGIGTLNVDGGGTFHSSTALTTISPTGRVSLDGGRYNSNGDLTINGGRFTLGSAGVFALDAGRTLTVENGGNVSILGTYSSDEASTILVTGAGSRISAAMGLSFNGGSTVSLTAGGAIRGFTDLNVGTAGNGTVTADGAGSLVFGGIGNVGSAGATGILSFSNGSSGIFSTVNVGNSGSGTSGAVTVRSGATVEVSRLNIATQSTATIGTVTVTGSGSDLTVGGAGTNIGAASGSSGILRVEPGGDFNSSTALTTVNATGTIAITRATFNARGPVTLNGGQLTVDTEGVFALNAAQTLTVQAAGSAIFAGAFSNTTASTIVVTGSGSRFSTTSDLRILGGSSLNVTAGGRLESGALAGIGTAGGNGSVNVDGVGSSFTGDSLIIGQAGFAGSVTFTDRSTGQFSALALDVSATPGTDGSLVIQSGASVIGANLLLASLVADNSGTVTITGVGSALTLIDAAVIGAANTSSGTLNVNSGARFNTGTGLTDLAPTGRINLISGTLALNGPLTVSGSLAIGGAGTIDGVGGITKLNAGTLNFPNRNSYGGGTIVRGGTVVAGAANGALGAGNVIVESNAVKLSIQSGVLSAIADNATLTLAGGGLPNVADNGFAELAAGVNEIVGGLTLGFEVQPPGTYGSTASPAIFQSNEFFSGSGMVTVIPEPGASLILLGGMSALFGLRRYRPKPTGGHKVRRGGAVFASLPYRIHPDVMNADDRVVCECTGLNPSLSPPQ